MFQDCFRKKFIYFWNCQIICFLFDLKICKNFLITLPSVPSESWFIQRTFIIDRVVSFDAPSQDVPHGRPCSLQLIFCWSPRCFLKKEQTTLGTEIIFFTSITKWNFSLKQNKSFSNFIVAARLRSLRTDPPYKKEHSQTLYRLKSTLQTLNCMFYL